MSLRNWKCLMLLVWGERFCTAVAVTGYLLKLLHIRCYTNTDKHPKNLCLTETGNEKSERNTKQYLYHTLRKKACYTLILKKKKKLIILSSLKLRLFPNFHAYFIGCRWQGAGSGGAAEAGPVRRGWRCPMALTARHSWLQWIHSKAQLRPSVKVVALLWKHI